jgi:16S rRNA (cytidine1402-2'-O)-methyltransferase
MRSETANGAMPSQPGYGVLFAVSTPIGNLEDITLRALRILKAVSMIAAESVARTKGLCQHHGIRTKLTSFNQHNQKVKLPELIRILKFGSDLALVSDAGTPGISDPGATLINRALREGIRVTPIPGPSAVSTALSVSGMPVNSFVFAGFLPNKPGRRKKALKELVTEARTLVFFEAPHRLIGMLTDLKEIFGDRHIVLLREMTKIFEEIKGGRISHILDYLTPEKLRGEFTLVVGGQKEQEKTDSLTEEVRNRITELISNKTMSTKDVAGLVSREHGLSYRQVYKQCLSNKRTLEGVGGNAVDQET